MRYSFKMRRKEMSGGVIRGSLSNQTTYRFETKFQYTASRSSRILSSQEAASFCSSLIFRLFFPAYLRLENIFFSSFSRGSRLSFHPVLPFARIGMQNDVMSLGKSLDSARLVLVTINIIQTVIVSLPPRRKTKMHCRQK